MFVAVAAVFSRFRVLILGAAVIVLVIGVAQLAGAPVDVYPEFDPPLVQIQTEAPGLSAAEVEQLVTVPLEQDLLNGVPWLETIRSTSVPGLSSIDVVFESGTDLQKARQQVNERLTQAAALPNVGTPPIMLQPLSSTSRVLMIGLSARDLSLVDLSVLARWKIKPRLMGVPGVANVALYGQRDRQLQVQVDPERLRRNNVTLSQVITTTGNSLWVSPLTFVEASTPGTGGFIETGTQRLAIQHVLPITRAGDLAGVAVEDRHDARLKLGDVARVVEGNQPLIGDAVVGNGPGLMLVVEKFPGTDTRAVTKGVEDALGSLRPGMPGVKIDTSVYRPASYQQDALGNLRWWAAAGLVLLLLVVGLGLFSWRAAVAVLVTVPLSLVTAALVVYLTGGTLNSMVLAGLVVALAVVVDEVVSSVAAVAGAPDRSPPGLVRAALASRTSAAYATVVLVLAVVPVYLLPGVTGAFTRPLVASYVLALLASTVVALVVTPPLALLLLRDPPRRTAARLRVLRRGYDRVALGIARNSLTVLAGVGVLVVVGLLVLPQLGGRRAVLPAVHDRDLLIRVQSAPGTALPEMTRLTTGVSHDVAALPGVRDVGAHVGRALLSDQIVNVDRGEVWVRLKGNVAQDTTVSAIRRVLGGYPGLRAQILNYPSEQLAAAQTGADGDLVVRVYGEDYPTLQASAEKVKAAIAAVPGVVAPTVQALDQQPTVQVTVNLAAAERYGIKPGDVRRAAAAFFAGLPVGNLYEEQKIFDVVVWSAPEHRRSPSDLADLLIDTPSGGQVRLGDVASVQVVAFPTAIWHNSSSRTLDVTAKVTGHNLATVTREAEKRVAALPMPQDFHAEVLPDAMRQHSQGVQTLGLLLGALIAIYFVLQSGTQSWRLAGLLMLTAPLACVGVVPAAFMVQGGVTSLGTLLAVFAVLGLTVRHQITLIRDYRRLDEPGQVPVLEATRKRARSIVVTALATAAAFAPVLLAGDVAGAELLHPMAVTLLGGLVTTTLFTLFLLPALYVRLFQPPAERPSPSTAPGPAGKEG